MEAGADAIMIQEEIVPALSSEGCDTWANLLAPTINIVRFYEALPMLNFCCAHLSQEDWSLIDGQQWDCIRCAPAEVISSRQKEGSPPTDDGPFGIALPLDVFQLNSAYDKVAVQDIQTWISDLRPGIITTAGDLPITTDMKQLLKVFEGIPRGV